MGQAMDGEARVGVDVRRVYAGEGDPLDAVRYVGVNVSVGEAGTDRSVFAAKNKEMPEGYSSLAATIIVAKYMRKRGVGGPDGAEQSMRQVVHRIAHTLAGQALRQGVFGGASAADFEAELAYLMANQYVAFNSPVWFNCGLFEEYGIRVGETGGWYWNDTTRSVARASHRYERPQLSACQPYDALVSTERGLLPIGRIVEDNMVGLRVWDDAGLTTVQAVKANGKKEVYRIVLADGFEVEATGDHLVCAHARRREKAHEWVKVERLVPGMYMRVHPRACAPVDGGTPLEVSEAALAGWLQTDGFVGQYEEGTNRSLTVEFITINDDERAWVEGHLARVFPDAHRHVSKEEVADPSVDFTRIRLYGEHLRPFVETYGLRSRNPNMRVPEVVLRAPDAVVAAYLRSVFQADGYVSVKDSSALIGLSKCSREMMQGVQRLLARLGCYARLGRKEEKRADRHDQWCVTVGTLSERRRFAERVGFIGGVKSAKLDRSLEMDGLDAAAVRFVPIERIERVGEAPVYDIQTASGRYLSGGGVLVHNCFIQRVDDDLSSIFKWYHDEAMIFSGGGGSGTSLDRLRGSREQLSGGGNSSGAMTWADVADRAAGATKSGGTTRRAATMRTMRMDHPEIVDFITWKEREERKAQALMAAGYSDGMNGEAYRTVSGQNSNNSVRVTDAFMHAVEADGEWQTTMRTTGKVCDTHRARDLWRLVATSARNCADPGVQFDTVINDWHTVPNAGAINSSNPCQPGIAPVLTREGIRTFDDIDVGSVIWSGQRWTTVRRKVYTGVKPVFRHVTRAGDFVGTEDHRVFQGGERVQARDAESIDVAIGPSAVRVECDPQDVMDGWVIGDGSRHVASGGLVYLNVGEKDGPVLADHLADFVVVRRPGIGDYAWEVRTTVVADEVPPLPGRRVPQRFLRGGSARACGFLRGLYAANGSMCDERVTLKAASIGLIRDVQQMLSSLGIGSYYTVNKPSVVDFANGPYECHESYDLNVTVDRGRFAELIGFLHPHKAEKLAAACGLRSRNWRKQTYDVVERESLGEMPVWDIEVDAPEHSYWTGGLLVSNCSEFLFLDDTACNLASIRLTKFLRRDYATGVVASGSAGDLFDVDGFCSVVRTLIIAQEAIVDYSSYPTEPIARNSHDFRPLGIGYADLGAMLMELGLPYDSNDGREVAAAITSLMTGHAYATSAELAGVLGPFNGFEANRAPMLRVIRKHRDAAAEIDPSVCGRALYDAVQAAWDRALQFGELHGYRNAQVSLVAPTGTISFAMDCSTTGIEPDFALVKFKKLAGGGDFKQVNEAVTRALRRLGYGVAQAAEIVTYMVGTGTLRGAPHLNESFLRSKGLTTAEVERVEEALPVAFSLHHALSPAVLGLDAVRRLGLEGHLEPASGSSSAVAWKKDFSPLTHAWGLNEAAVNEASDCIVGRGTVEGAPHLRDEHLPVFDCAARCGRTGRRTISPEGHVDMVAAVQRHLSGAVSKTINLPADVGVDDIERVYDRAWRKGVKAVAVYPDGAKNGQPLSTAGSAVSGAGSASDRYAAALDELLRRTEPGEMVAALAAPPEYVASLNAAARKALGQPVRSPSEYTVIRDNLQRERSRARVPKPATRVKLPARRGGFTQEARIGGHKVFLRTGEYEDGQLGEIFIDVSKQGSATRAAFDALAVAVSVGLQHGVPPAVFVEKFAFFRCEPNGPVEGDARVRFATSIFDYLARTIGVAYCGRDDLAHVAPEHGAVSDGVIAADDMLADGSIHHSEAAAVTAKIDGDGTGAARPTGNHCASCSADLRRVGTCEVCINPACVACGTPTGGCS